MAGCHPGTIRRWSLSLQKLLFSLHRCHSTSQDKSKLSSETVFELSDVSGPDLDYLYQTSHWSSHVCVVFPRCLKQKSRVRHHVFSSGRIGWCPIKSSIALFLSCIRMGTSVDLYMKWVNAAWAQGTRINQIQGLSIKKWWVDDIIVWCVIASLLSKTPARMSSETMYKCSN